MKSIRIQIHDDLHTRLKALCSHQGELSHLIRQGVRLIVVAKEREKELLTKSKEDEE